MYLLDKRFLLHYTRYEPEDGPSIRLLRPAQLGRRTTLGIGAITPPTIGYGND